MTPAAHLETNLSTESASRQRGRTLIVALLFAGLLATSVGMAAPAHAVQRYQATINGLALRTTPGTGPNDRVLQRVNRGTPLDAVCAVIDENIGGNYVWLRLTGGQYVSDYYTTSDGWGTRFPTGLQNCNAGATVRRMGGTEPRNSAPAGQCTWLAKDRFRAATGVYPALYGDALNWANSARSGGWTVVANAEPRSIVVFQPRVHGADARYGHVGWVENVEVRPDGRYVHILEMNWTGPHQWSRRVLKHVPGMEYVLAP